MKLRNSLGSWNELYFGSRIALFKLGSWKELYFESRIALFKADFIIDYYLSIGALLAFSSFRALKKGVAPQVPL